MKRKYNHYSIKILIYHSIVILLLLCVNSKCYSTPISGNPDPNQIKHLQKITNNLKNEVDSLKRGLKTYIQENTLEKSASKMLLEISEKNLKAPGIILTAFGILVTIFIAIVGMGSIYVKRLLVSFHTELKEAIKTSYSLLADSFNQKAIEEYKKNIYKAIEFGEQAVFYAKLALGVRSMYKELLYFCQSNLAYYYVEGKRKEKKCKSIKYATNGLEIGEELLPESGGLNLIDNYLYVTKCFDYGSNHKNKWIEIYEKYSDLLFKEGIRTGLEKEEYILYYEEIKKFLKNKV